MKTITSITHIIILAALAFIAFFGLFSIPSDNSATWSLDFYISKAIGFAAAYLTFKACGHWSQSDPWLKAYDKMCKDVMDESNSSQL